MNSYTFHISLYGLAFLGAIFIGLTFAMLLWFTKTVSYSANRFIALVLVTIILWMVRVLAIDLLPESSMRFQFLLALGPLLYFYVLKITQPKHAFRWKDLPHFSPLLLEQAMLPFAQLAPLLQLLIFISLMIYLYKCNKLIESFYGGLPLVLMDRPRIEFRWLRRLLAATALLWCLWIACAAVDYFGYHNQLGVHLYYPFYIFFAVVIIWTAAAAFLKPQTAMAAQAAASPKQLVPVELRAKGAWLKRSVEANLYYQDPELSLSSLAEKLSLPPHELSRVINTVFKKSFNDFINEYRVMDAARKMQDPAYENITLLGIGFEAGFNSKTTFNRIFKQMTGNSPTEYKNQVEKERPTYNLGRKPRQELLILNREPLQRWGSEKLNSYYMFKNYVKIAWRNLIKNKVPSLINVSGLAVGMAVAMLIGLWIWNELSFDKYHKSYESIVRVMQNQTTNGEVSSLKAMPQPVAYELRRSYGNEFKYVVLSSWTNPHLISYNDKNIAVPGNYMEQDAPEMLTLDMAAGAAGALKSPASILLSESTCKAVLGSTDAIGKIIKLDGAPLKVSGVYHDIPLNATFSSLGFIAPWALYASAQDVRENITNWNANSYQIFAQVADPKNIAELSAKIKEIKLRNTGKEANTQIFLFPMSRWHLYAEFKNGLNSGGSITYVWMFAIIGIFVLVLAGINFMNLSTARSEKRAKEVGIRKSIGSSKRQLVWQFLTESLLVSILALVVALGLVQVTLPYFNNLTGKQISILWTNPMFWLAGIGFAVISGLFAGSYPAFYLSSFQPLKVLKGVFKTGRLASLPRKVLIVIQFTFSAAMIIGTAVVLQQVHFAKKRPSGYGRQGLIMLRLYSGDLHKNIEAFTNELLQTTQVSGVAESGNQITKGSRTSTDFNWPDKDPNSSIEFSTFAISPQYGKTVWWQVIAGRDFSQSYPSDSSGLVLNQSAVKQMGLKNPVGQVIEWDDKKYTIVGVTKDMIVESPYEPIKPTIFYTGSWPGLINIRISPQASTSVALATIKAVCNKYAPADPFDYKFVDDEYAQKFGDEERVGKLASFFAGLAIFISCLGLFGMASFMAEQRVKEIGVRKVLGASVFSLWQLLTKDFVVLVAIALLVASPPAYYFMHNWLQNYAYRTAIGWPIFAATALGAIGITLITVSFQSIKAALANPVKSLRSE